MELFFYICYMEIIENMIGFLGKILAYAFVVSLFIGAIGIVIKGYRDM